MVSRVSHNCRMLSCHRTKSLLKSQPAISAASDTVFNKGNSYCDSRPVHHTLKDTYLIICNHNLNAMAPHQLQTETFSSCGHCSIAGVRNPFGVGDRHSAKSLHLGTSLLSQYTSMSSSSPVDANWVVVRGIHTTAASFKEESKAELAVKALKDEVKVKSEPVDPPPFESPLKVVPTSRIEPAPPKDAKAVADEASKSVAKKSLTQRIIAEVKHYYHGFRLLFIDVRVCIRSIWQVMNGKSLSRRERRQLVRTTSDLFRLLPFSVFIVVPFMEFLLPVALKLFPGMLPSTFAQENKEQEKLRKKLKVKLEMAKFLQDTIEETALTRKGAKGESAQEFVNFMERVRQSGEETSNEEIMKYSKLFDEDITLDNLSYAQLQALLRLLDMPVVGTSNFLRFRLRMKLRQLEADDRIIMKEGMDSLTVWELQEACRTRGMRALGVPKDRLQTQLGQWLDLHIKESIPTSLLLLSRALYLPEELSKEEQLKATISALPETMAEEAKVKISEVTGDRVDHKSKLEIIRQEEQTIKQEAEEEAKQAEQEAKKAEAKKAEEEAKKLEEELLVDRAEVIGDPLDVVKAAAEPITPSIVDSAPELKVSSEEVLVDPAETEGESGQEISKTDLEEIEDVLELVAEEKSVDLDKDELDALKEDVSEYKETLEDLREVVLSSLGGQQELEESKSAKRLSKKVYRMVSQMDAIMHSLNDEKSVLMEDIEIKEVKVKRSSDEVRQGILDEILLKKKNVVSINELLLAIRRIQKVPEDTKYQRIAEVLDEDSDGVIDINDALKVIELLGRENVSVQTDHMTELMDLLRKEAVIEQDDKEEKLREKLEKQKAQESDGKTESETVVAGESPSSTTSVEKKADESSLRDKKEQKQ